MTDPYSGDKLAEPGAGWMNVPIESAHLKAAMEPDNAGDRKTDFVAGTDPDLNRQWLRSLRHPAPREPKGCVSCGTETTRVIATEAYQVKGRNWALRGVYQCEGCEEKVAIAKLERVAANPDVLPHLRADAVAELAALKAAPRSSSPDTGNGTQGLHVAVGSGVQS